MASSAQALQVSPMEMETRAFVTRVYGWMSAGLALTGVIAYAVAGSEELVRAIVLNRWVFWGLLLAELALVWILSAAIQKMSMAVASAMFLAYAVLNGLTLSVIFLVYTSGSLALTFFVTGGTFFAMCTYGATTKRDLTSMGNLMFMALIGLILASVANWFFQNPVLYWITTYAGVGIFVGLTAYDAQKIKQMSLVLEEGSEAERKGAITGALALYLDFINLFLFMLRIFGRRR
jgi:FtsH-binding integral membrane protein